MSIAIPSTVDELFEWMDPILTTFEVQPEERASLKTRIDRIRLDSDDLGKCMSIICIGDEAAERLQHILPSRADDHRILICVVPKLTTEEVVQTTVGEENVIR